MFPSKYDRIVSHTEEGNFIMSQTQRVGSRLAKVESKKMMKQTVLFIVASVVLLVVFLFVIIPGLIRFISSGGDVNQIVQSDTIPPQVPLISAPATATYSASIQLEGYGENQSELVVVLNGNEDQRAKIETNDGKFQVSVPLQEGENNIAFYAVDDAGNESALSKTYTILYDKNPPAIKMENPQDGQTIELLKNQNVTVKGTTEPGATVYVNGRRTYANTDGIFSSNYQLTEGENKIMIRVEDVAGNVSEQDLTVTFKL